MPAFLDDEQINPERFTLAAVLAKASAMADERGRIIVEVSVNGEDLQGDALHEPADDDLGDADVRLFSANPADVAGQALSDASAQLVQTRERQSECAGLVQVGKITEAMGVMSECLGDWQAARSVVLSVMQLTDVSSASAESTIEGLAVKLDELKSALTGQDWSTVADLLAFDLDEQVTSWTSMLDDMRKTVEGRAEGS